MATGLGYAEGMAETKKYRVYLTSVVCTSVDVEIPVTDEMDAHAEREAALERAYVKMPGSLCHQCAYNYEMTDEWHPGGWTQGEADLKENVVPR